MATVLMLVGSISILLGSWWLYHNMWLFPSRHDHGEGQGCGRIYMLPSSWKLPFGSDKLLKSLGAEKERRLPLLSLEDHELYGDTYGQYSGGLFTILTRDSRNIASLLSEQFSKFDYGNLRQLCFGCLLGESIFTENGENWRRSRRLLAPELHRPKFPSLAIIESHFQDMLRAMTSGTETSPRIGVRPIFYNFTLDTATDLFLGVSTNLLALPSSINEEGKRFSSSFDKTLPWLATKERFKMFAWLVTGPELWSLCYTARDSLENLIIEAQRREVGSSFQPFTDFLGKTTDVGKARDELMSLLFAGRDTNASLLCWVVYALAREPTVFEKLEREILSITGTDSNATPNDSDLMRMHYLEDVIYECLRLFPVVPINGRMCNTTTTLPAGGGKSGEEPILVPKGTLVCFSTFGCHRSTKYYGEDAMTFRPERWREVDVRTRTQNYTFHPFIGGPRKCLGESFALKLTKYTICRLVQCFRAIEADDPSSRDGADWQEDIKYRIGLTMSPDNDVHVRLTTR
ncbi:cytochrome P450 [Xylaria castorea]|nr:cytochrome P450 [Xylaria castorea]